MRRDLLDLAAAQGGLVTRAQALRCGGRHIVDDAVNDSVLRRLCPGVYVVAEAAADGRLMRRAALAYLPDGALSHLDALDLWGVGRVDSRIHLSVPRSHPAVAHPMLVVHRLKDFRVDSPVVVVRDGLRVVRLERALVESWALLPAVERRAPLITALRERRTTADRMRAALEKHPHVPGGADMRRLVALVAGGCHSELEIWGHERVFSDPRLPPSDRQHAVDLGGRTAYLDRYFRAERVDVELDGAAWHGEPGQRERDLRRDAALSAVGIQVVRYSHRRMCAEPDLIVEELRAILPRRREFLAAV